MQINYKHHDSQLVFRRTADKIQLLGLFVNPPFPGTCLKGSSILELQFTTRACSSGLGQVHTVSDDRMKGVMIDIFTRQLGDLLVIILKDLTTSMLVEINYLLYRGLPIIRMWARVRNDSSVPINLHMIRSTILHNIGGICSHLHRKNMVVYYCADLGRGCVYRQNLAQPPPKTHPWVMPGTLPIGVVEEADTGRAWYWHLEHPLMWNWEIGERTKGCLSLWTNNHVPRQQSSRKELKPGLAVETSAVSFGLASGGSHQAWDVLDTYWRYVLKSDQRLLAMDYRH